MKLNALPTTARQWLTLCLLTGSLASHAQNLVPTPAQI